MNTTGWRMLFSRRSLRLVALPVSLLMAATGCTLCQDCGDLEYPTYGGAWERTRRDAGRVGSVFDPAGARAATLSDRDAIAESDVRAPAESIDELGPSEPKQESFPDDPRNQDEPSPGSGKDTVPSPSDREQNQRKAPGSDTLRELELEDISIERGEVLPPDL